MGLNWHGVRFLAQAKSNGVDFSRTITIGRLTRNVRLFKVRRMLDECGISHTLDENSDDRVADSFFKQLGATTVDSLDASEYQGATIIADLNKPLPQEYACKYDVVYDGGTLEHVFNVPQALSNVMSLVRVGGDLMIHTMANNWLGHGFYQFSPELFYRVLTPENGFSIVRVVAHAAYELAPWYEVPDPAAMVSRIEGASRWDGILLMIHARRISDVPIFTRAPQQSDYAARWRDAADATDVQASSVRARPASSTLSRIEDVRHRVAREVDELMISRFAGVSRELNKFRHRVSRRRAAIEAQPMKFKAIP